VGTELNLVLRLAREYAGRKTVLPLARVACSNMAKITENKLAALLRSIVGGRAEPVVVSPALAEPARLALERMLEACA